MKNKRLILAIASVFILVMLVIGIIYFFKSSENKIKNPPKAPYKTNTTEMQASEDKAFSELEIAAQDYITKTYPNASAINAEMEFIGMSYGVVNTSFKNNGENKTLKVYLEDNGNKWIEIYADKDQITCEKVKELINRQTILSSMCK